MPRTFRPGQRAELFVIDVLSGEPRRVLSSKKLVLEAPNWTPDGDWLVVNGDGKLFRTAASGEGGLEEIPLDGVPPINNDHVLSPDGLTVYVSADDGHVYAVPFSGGTGRRVTNDHGNRFAHYLHGVSPDGATLSYIGAKTKKDGRTITDVFTIPSAGGIDARITDDAVPDDGAEFSPDGAWIYFNSERGSDRPGHAQLFRIAPDGVVLEQLTHDKRVNWFPHPSPDGTRVAYVSYRKKTTGHPADQDVQIRILDVDLTVHELVSVFGGQGTMNVPSWSPDSKHLAYVAYPISS
jgi:Tol biopolymer transport system component